MQWCDSYVELVLNISFSRDLQNQTGASLLVSLVLSSRERGQIGSGLVLEWPGSEMPATRWHVASQRAH